MKKNNWPFLDSLANPVPLLSGTTGLALAIAVQSSHVKKFLVHLAVEGNVSSSTQNQAFNALLFLFRYVLEKEFDVSDNIIRAKKVVEFRLFSAEKR